EETVRAFSLYPDAVGVFSDGDCVDSDLNKLGHTFNGFCWSDFFSLDFDNNDMCLLKSQKYRKRAVEGNILGGCCLAVKNVYLKKMFPFCPNIYHDDWLCYCMLSLGDVVAFNKPLFAYRLHGNNTVGFENLVSNNASFGKKLRKAKRAVKNMRLNYINNAQRAIYFYEFSKKNNLNMEDISFQQKLNREKINSAVSGKLEGIKNIKIINKEIGLEKSNMNYLECLYILLYSKRRRKEELKDIAEFFKNHI
ncbi:MAG: hypothetical protein ACI4QE_02650, partial [Acutalibacteraceae bacterium]